MRKAIIKKRFTNVQWFDKDYPYYEDDAKLNVFEVGDEVLVLHEADPNPMSRLYVVFNERNNESSVIAKRYLEFI